MKAKVYGIQRNVKWTYQDKSGTNQRLHVLYPDALPGDDEGYRVECIKVSHNVDLQDVHPGDVVEIYFNRFGNVEQVVKV